MSTGYHPSKVDGLDQRTSVIVYGYIKTIEQLLYIPSEIKVITLAFVGDYYMYQGKYSWIIDNKQLNEDIITAQNKFQICSSHFKMASIEWQIKIQPNGDQYNSVGSFVVILHCQSFDSLPSKIRGNKITVCRRIYCNELRSSHTYISNYQINTGKGWPDWCLVLDEVKKSKLNQLTFTVEIQILRILNYNTILYEQPIYYDMPFKNQLFEWKIDEELLKRMKNSYPGKKFESEIFNKMWCLTVAPNGDSKDYEDDFDVFLTLCSLPANVSKIGVNWKIVCKEMKIKTDRMSTFRFDDDCTFCWSKNKVLSFKDFIKYDEWRMSLEIEILSLFDNKGVMLMDLESDKFMMQNKNIIDEKYSRNKP